MIVARQLYRNKPLTSSAVRLLTHYASNPTSPGPAKSFSGGDELVGRLSGFVYPVAFARVRKTHDQCNLYYCNVRCFTSHAAVENPVGGMVDVPLAQTGEGIAECELLKWFVQEGDQVEEFQPLCEVQSDKATIEITSRCKGMVSHILHAPGDIVKVGETLLKITVEDFPPAVVDGLTETESNMDGSKCDSTGDPSLANENPSSGVSCTPAVRDLAKQLGVDLNFVKGSGEDGRILKVDVLKCVNRTDADQPSASFHRSDQSAIQSFEYEDKTFKLRGFQRAMVKSMTMAARIPHFHYVEELNCDALVELKSSFQKENTDPSIKHTFLPFLVKSLSMALIKYPTLNSSFNEDMNEIIVRGCHNIGIAMATPYGLVVPNIKKVQSLSVLEITKEISRLQQLAVENKLSQDDITNGTITISNIGAIGGKFGSPLINVPEVAIIAIGRIQKVPRFSEDGSVYPVPVMNVNIGADHRVLDGAAIANFCNELKSFVEKPELLLLNMR